jgi:DNA-binding PadR family transcriptional regulator
VAVLKKEILTELRKRTIKKFLDVFIMAQLRKEPKGAYDIIAAVHEKFYVIISSGTVYSVIYSMERDGLVRSSYVGKRKVYMLTEKGEKIINVIIDANSKAQPFITRIFHDLIN